jgi:hypothetical protein
MDLHFKRSQLADAEECKSVCRLKCLLRCANFLPVFLDQKHTLAHAATQKGPAAGEKVRDEHHSDRADVAHRTQPPSLGDFFSSN